MQIGLQVGRCQRSSCLTVLFFFPVMGARACGEGPQWVAAEKTSRRGGQAGGGSLAQRTSGSQEL